MGSRREREEEEATKWVRDFSVDHKGSAPLRSSTGVWRASLFILAMEFSERVSYFGIATNMITYLTKVMRQELGGAAKNVNYWAGVTTVMPLLGGFFADAYVGRFQMVLFSSLVYLLGLGLFTMTQYIPSLKPCGTHHSYCPKARTTHDVAFFTAAYMISAATGGFKPCLESFGADQFDDGHPGERRKKASFFNWWNAALCLALVLAVTAVVYVEDNAGWGVAFLALTVAMAASLTVFCVGARFYRYRAPARRSPFTPMLQVLAAAFANRNLPHPSSPSLLYDDPNESRGRRLCHTMRFRFLDKAAIITQEKEETPPTSNDDEQPKQSNPWKLATLTQVEELKMVVGIIPVWLTSMIIGVNISQCTTFFVKQAAAMDRRLTPTFDLPPASVYSLSGIGMILSVTAYDRLLLPALRRATRTEQGLTVLRRIGIGMAIANLSMAVAALVEARRLALRATVVLSVGWLVPQFLIFGMAEGFMLVGLQEFFYEEVPDSMRSLGMAMYLSVIGIGSFLSSLLIAVVDCVTERDGGVGWIGKDVDHSRLDLFYWVLVALNVANLGVFVVFARGYSYKRVRKGADNAVGDRLPVCTSDG